MSTSSDSPMSVSSNSSSRKRSFSFSSCDSDPYEFRDVQLRYFELDYASPVPKSAKKVRLMSHISSSPIITDTKPCGCKNRCDTNRCHCRKNGMVCGFNCKCDLNCCNPMNKLEIFAEYGVDIDKCKEDTCLMHCITKLTDEEIRNHLETDIELYCCDTTTKLHTMIPGKLTCPGEDCVEPYVYSWCDWEIVELGNGYHRNHCRKCKRCVGRSETHCNKCNHCCRGPCSCHC
ncbi:uncharacterized protein LOC144349990 [Saccoglossus kowalevskii]